MAKLKFNVFFDTKEILKNFKIIKKVSKRYILMALEETAKELLKNARKYVPILTGRLRDSGHLVKKENRYIIDIIYDAANPKNDYIYAEKQYKEVLQHIDGFYRAEWIDKAINENPYKYVYLTGIYLFKRLTKDVR